MTAAKMIAAALCLSAFAASAQVPNRDALREELNVNLVWQWDNNPGSCLNALGLQKLDVLQTGQKHNKHAQDVYSFAARDLPDFWQDVMTVSVRRCDMAEFTLNLKWQYQNNIKTVVDARDLWLNGDVLSAGHTLLSGQIHNPAVLSLYRACMRDDLKGTFGVIDALVGH